MSQGTIDLKSKNQIMRTAFLTAFPKLFTDIYFSHRFFSEMIYLANEFDFSFETSQFIPDLALEIEGRYKALTKCLKQKIDQISDSCVIIEIAAGFSPRRMEFLKNSYYELDLKNICELKKELYRRLGCNEYSEYVLNVDLADSDCFRDALLTIFHKNKDKKVIIISEGLFWYLNRKEISSFSKIIKEYIEKYGGFWINADCPVQLDISEKLEYRTVIPNSSNRNIDEPFSNYGDYEKFFKDLGFKIDVYSITDLVSESDFFSGRLFSIGNAEIKKRCQSYTNIAVFT